MDKDKIIWSYDDSDNEEEKSVLDPAELGNLFLRNRIFRSATWEGLAGPDGSLNDDIYVRYGALADGGAAAIITGFTSVSDDDQSNEGMMRLSHDSLIEDYRKLTDRVHGFRSYIFSQLALGDYMSEGRSLTVDELSSDDIEHVKKLFTDAAVRAAQAGFDGIQLHAAHGYFLSRFLSPYFNHRKDEYGGTAMRRAKLMLDIVDEIKKEEPGLSIIVQVNFYDGVEGGLTMSDALTACSLLADHGVDAIEVSGDKPARKDIKVPYEEAYLKEYALALKSICDVPVILAGGHRTLESMNKVLNEDSADFLSMARPLICEPDLPKKLHRDPKYVSRCNSCNKCFSTPGHECVLDI